MRKILILANSASGLYDFRNELLLRLQQDFEVHVSLPDEETVPELAQEGCKVYHTPLDRRGINPVKDLKLLLAYNALLRKIKPDMVLTYTIKPNIYGGLCCIWKRTSYITSITGLGSGFEKKGMIQDIVVCLYRLALAKSSCVFFQNKWNRLVFERHGIKMGKIRMVSGSGVNLEKHTFTQYPPKEEPVRLLYVGRLMKEKGIEELLYAAREIKKEFSSVIFELVGSYEEDYKTVVEQCQQEGIVRLTGYQREIRPYYRSAWAVLMPSYHEGMSNVILEAAATGRPVLASDIPGCREGFDEMVTGYGCQPRNKDALLDILRRFLALSYEEKVQMGCAARAKMEREFDRRRVVNSYMEEIQAAVK